MFVNARKIINNNISSFFSVQNEQREIQTDAVIVEK